MPWFYLLAGVFCCSTAVIWIKESTVDPVLLTGMRLGIAAVALSPLAWADWRRHRDQLNWTHLRDALLPGMALCAHFITWIIGARMTLASNGTLIVNLTPIVTPFLLLALLGERVTRREIVATLVALVGLIALFVSDFHFSYETLRGDLFCLVSMLLSALYLTLGRKFRHHPTVWLFVVPLYACAALGAFALSPWLADWSPIDWPKEAPWILILALIPTVLGHSLVMTSMRYFRGQVVSVVYMIQFIPAGIIAWLMLSERPQATFYAAAAIISWAGYLVTSRSPGDPEREPEPPLD